MSRQIQIRRGSAAEHENFTGAIGEITMDTTNNTLRVHDGVTAGGTALAKQSELPDLSGADYVVESQLPTAQNNYTWYRKYKSGWVEQGGIYQKASFSLGSGSTTEINSIAFAITLSETPKVVSITEDMNFFNTHVIGRTTSSIKIKISNQLPVSYTQAACNIFWSVSGQIAS